MKRDRLLRPATQAIPLAAILIGTVSFLGGNSVAIATPIPVPAPLDTTPPTQPREEIDSSISRDYKPAIIYLHDPVTHWLVPHTMSLPADQPVVAVVDQIIQAYKGQETGIKDYDVQIDSTAHQAAIDFTIDHPRGSRVLESLSSTNQYSLFEAIRQTLLTQPAYNIDIVIFRANGKLFDI